MQDDTKLWFIDQFFQMGNHNNHVKKITEQRRGEEIREMFNEMTYGDKMQMYKYNIYRQYSKLKFLKKNESQWSNFVSGFFKDIWQ